MKFKDYYAIMGLDRKASPADIKKAYRRLARKFHPDVSKEPDGEARFKEVAEAYETLKDPGKREAYDQLGRHQPGEDFRPPPDWGKAQGGPDFSFEDLDLSDLLAALSGGRQRAGQRGGNAPMPGQDYEANAQISLEEAFCGTELALTLEVPEYDQNGISHRVRRTIKARIPTGATDGQRLRLPGKGGKGRNGGQDGNLYINIALHPHPLFRVSGHDLFLDLPLTPWEAALGATVQVPTLGGEVRLKVPPGTRAGQQLRVTGRGLPKPKTGAGDLFALVQIAVPSVLSEQERILFQSLAGASTFNPRSHFARS
jgi:curved DNA-binding protein